MRATKHGMDESDLLYKQYGVTSFSTHFLRRAANMFLEPLTILKSEALVNFNSHLVSM